MHMLLLAAALLLQSRDATLRVTVTDPSGAVIVGAAVQIVNASETTPTSDASQREQPNPPDQPSQSPQSNQAIATVLTDSRGEARFAQLSPGGYLVRVEFPGFEPYEIADVRLRPGQQQRRTVRLTLAKIAQAITVERDPRDRALDPRGDAFTTILLPHQIALLPDDPEEMARILLEMAGPGATMRVNGFRSNRLPPSDQIAHVRFRRNAFAADTHEAGGVFVDVITKPGGEQWRGTTSAAFRDSALNARNALAVRKEEGSLQRYTLSIGGPLVRGRTSASLAIDATSSVDARTILAFLPDRTVNDVSTRPLLAFNVNGRVEHALSAASGPGSASTGSQMLRVEFDRTVARTDRVGVGDFNLPERGYRQDARGAGGRVSIAGALGRRAFNELKLQARQDSASFFPENDTPAVVVMNAFSSGGAQIVGARRSRQFEIADDIDIPHGNHALRAGFLFETTRVTSDVARNSEGTFTFASLDAFRAGRATTFTRNAGDPRTNLAVTQWGLYLQDDYRARRDLTLSIGVRQEYQSIVGSWRLGPRASAAWSPFASGRTTIRAGGGVFFDWFDARDYEYARQLDGTHQQVQVVIDPAYPGREDTKAVTLPPGRVVISNALDQPRIVLGSIGIEQRVASDVRLHAIWTRRRGTKGLRGLNVNAPIDHASGARPDPASGPIVAIESSARARMDSVSVTSTYSPARRALFATATYTWSQSENETNSPTSVPADATNLAAEWGPALDDVRHRLTAMFSTPIAGLRRVRFGMSVRLQSGAPYDITTGGDDNGDTTSNDRPPGVSRHAARGGGQADLSARVGWTLAFGKRRSTGGGPAVLARSKGDGDALAAFGSAADPTKRFNVELYAQAFNLLNHVNPTSYSGVISSPVFGRPITVAAPRRLELGSRLRF